MNTKFYLKSYHTKAPLIGAFVFLFIFITTSQRYAPTKPPENYNKYQIDSIAKVAGKLAKEKNWDEYYQTVKQIYTIGNKSLTLEKLLPKIEQFVKVIPKSENIVYSKGQILLAVCHEKIGNTFTAQNLYETQVKLYHNLKDNPFLQYYYNGLGIHYTKVRDYNSAIHHLKIGLILASRNKDTTYLNFIHDNLGIAYLWKGDYHKAHLHLDSALFYSNYQSASSYLEKSIAYRFETKYDSSWMMLKKIRLLENKFPQPDIKFHADAIEAALLSKTDNPNKSIEIYKSSLNQSSIQDKREILKVYIPYATLLLELGKPNEALQQIEQAEKLFNLNFYFNADNPIGIEMNLIELFEIKGRCYYHIFEKSKNIQHLYQAEKTFDKCLDIILNMRYILDNFSANEYLSKTTKPIFEQNIKISELLYQRTKDKKHLKKVNKVMQMFAAFNLKRTISERDALEQFISQPADRTKYINLKNHFLDKEYILNQQFNKTLFDQYTIAKKNFINFKDSLTKTSSSFKKAVASIPLLDVEKIQKSLTRNDVFLQYFVSNKTIYIYSIDQKNFQLIIQPVDSIFANNFATLANLLSLHEKSNHTTPVQRNEIYFKNANYLYNKIVEPVLKGKNYKNAIIVPDAYLYRIPFEALTYTSTPKDQSYLLKKYNFKYLYYTAQHLQKSRKNVSGDFFGMGLEYDKFTLESMRELKKEILFLNG